MQEHLKFNILNFNWPRKLLTFYFSLEKTEDCDIIHFSKYPDNISDIFKDEELEEREVVYTTFTKPREGFQPLKVDCNNYNLRLYKQFLNIRIKRYFDALNIVNRKNRILKDRQVWILDKKRFHNHYHYYDKFSLKIQFTKVSDYPELVVSFDGTAKILKQSFRDIDNSNLVKKAIYRTNILRFPIRTETPKQQEFYDSLFFDEIYPVLNIELQKKLNIPFQQNKTLNRYTKYLNKINEFAAQYLFNENFKRICDLRSEEFIPAPLNRVGHIEKEKGLLEYGKDKYGNKQTGLTPKLELNRKRPYSRPRQQNIKFFFIYHKEHEETIKLLWKQLRKGTGKYYRGLKDYIDIAVEPAKENSIEFTNKDNPISEIKTKLQQKEWDKNISYLGFYISPHSRFVSDSSLRNIYYQVKELFLNENIMTQAIDFSDLQSNINTYQWHLNNISLAIHAKLGGKPWKLAVTEKKELVIGVGAFTNQNQNQRYVASAFSFQNNGIFNRFDCFSKEDTELLAGSILNAIRSFFNQSEADKIVIHFYKEMSKKELKPIMAGLHKLNLENKPIYILNINKTESKDIIAYDTDFNSLMPYSGTFIRLGIRSFLLFNNGRFEEENFYPADGFPFPIKITISSPNEDDFEDNNIINELLNQVFQFSRLYWKSLKPQNVPITIKYPEMLAQIAPRFENGVPDHAKDKLWFL